MNTTQLIKTARLVHHIKKAASEAILEQLGDPTTYSDEELDSMSRYAGSRKREGLKKAIMPAIYGAIGGSLADATLGTGKCKGLAAVLGGTASGAVGYSKGLLDAIYRDRAVRRWALDEIERRETERAKKQRLINSNKRR